MIDTYGLNPFKVPEQQATFSSFTAPAPVVMQRTFVFPRAITSLAVTVTARGITSKNLLIGLESGQVASLHRRFIDPRRPNGKPSKTEMMEGLMTYSPYLPIIPFAMVTVNGSVMGLEDIHATSAVIESTSLVLSQVGATHRALLGCSAYTTPPTTHHPPPTTHHPPPTTHHPPPGHRHVLLPCHAFEDIRPSCGRLQ